MTTTFIQTEKVIYEVENHRISISKDLVDKYSTVVCPVTEKILIALIHAFSNSRNDKVLSAKIEADMETELCEYGL